MILTLRSKINFEKAYYYSLLLFAFGMPLSRATNSLFMILFIILLLIQGDYKKHYETLKSSPLAKSILLFSVFTTLSLLWTDNLSQGLNAKQLYLQWFAMFAIALNVKTKQIYSIISAFMLGMFVSEILSYGMFFDVWIINGKGGDYPTPFMHHIHYSVFLSFTALILLNRILSKRYVRKEKTLFILFFLTIAVNLFINDGRTGQIALLLGIFATVFIHYKLTFKSFLGAALFIILLFSSAYTFSNKFQTRVHAAKSDIQKILKGQLNSSWGTRVAMHYVAFDIVQENPIIGVGVGDYVDASKSALENNDHGFKDGTVSFISRSNFHNQYLNTVVQGGLIGLGIMFSILYYLIKLPILDPELKELSILFTIVFLIAFTSDAPWLVQYTNMLFILFVGLFLGASLNQLTKQPKAQQ